MSHNLCQFLIILVDCNLLMAQIEIIKKKKLMVLVTNFKILEFNLGRLCNL